MENGTKAKHKIVSFSPVFSQSYPGVQQVTLPLESSFEEKLEAVKDATILIGDYRGTALIEKSSKRLRT